ncbi:MAG: AI-2E family transporter [bacterium]
MAIDKKSFNINISTLTLVKMIVVVIILYFLWLISDIIAILFVSLIFASAVDPWIDWLQRHKIPRSIGVLIIYLVSFIVIVSIIYLIIPPIVKETGQLSKDLPHYIEKVSTVFSDFKMYADKHNILSGVSNAVESMNTGLKSVANGIFSTISSVFGGIFSFFLILVITFYMVVEENALKKAVWTITPDKHQTYVIGLINRIQKKIGLWLRGQLTLCFIVFLLTFMGLSIFNVKYALILALIAGLTEAIPYLGPTLAAIPAVFLAFTQSPPLALIVIALYFVIQMVENHILVPKIMQKAVGLNPLISISVLMIGFQIGGILGAVLSIPVATAASVAIKDLFNYKRRV